MGSGDLTFNSCDLGMKYGDLTTKDGDSIIKHGDEHRGRCWFEHEEWWFFSGMPAGYALWYII